MNSSFLVLASASPARRQVLQQAGIEPIVWASNFDESSIISEDPETLVTQLARGKAEAVAPRFSGQSALVLGCDSVMSLNTGIFGKPNNKQNALVMWEQMRGGKGHLHTGHCLIDVANQKTILRAAQTTVYFVNATDAEIESYIHTEESLQCAGAFTLEGLGGLLIDRIEGSPTNVLGLSLPLFRQMLRELGYAIRFTPDRKVYFR